MKRHVQHCAGLGIACFLLLLSEVGIPAHAQSNQHAHPKGDFVLGDRIAEGLVFDGNLWLRGTTGKNPSGDHSGALVSLSLADLSRQTVFDSGVLDIEQMGADLWVLRLSPSNKQEFLLSRWSGDSFKDLRITCHDKDSPLALLKGGDLPTVLCQKSIQALARDGTWKSVNLKGEIREGVQTALVSPIEGGSAYVGVNRGEWGGGLQKIDLRTGEVTAVERRDSKDLCSGPLNSECDPVTGVIPDLLNKDCVLSSVGLVHFLSHGRILRVCGGQVSVVFEHSETEQIDGRKLEVTEAFYGLAEAEGGFWAIAPRALYRFDADGKEKGRYALPELKLVSGVYISRELPGVLVVRTNVNWAVSASGYTPLVVVLRESKP